MARMSPRATLFLGLSRGRFSGRASDFFPLSLRLCLPGEIWTVRAVGFLPVL